MPRDLQSANVAGASSRLCPSSSGENKLSLKFNAFSPNRVLPEMGLSCLCRCVVRR